MIESGTYEALVELAALFTPKQQQISQALRNDIAQVQLLIAFKPLIRDLAEFERNGVTREMRDLIKEYDEIQLGDVLFDARGDPLPQRSIEERVKILKQEMPKELLLLVEPIAEKYAKRIGMLQLKKTNCDMLKAKERFTAAKAKYDALEERFKRDCEHYGIDGSTVDQEISFADMVLIARESGDRVVVAPPPDETISDLVCKAVRSRESSRSTAAITAQQSTCSGCSTPTKQK